MTDGVTMGIDGESFIDTSHNIGAFVEHVSARMTFLRLENGFLHPPKRGVQARDRSVLFVE